MKNKIINCKGCGEQLEKGARECVNCGKDQRNFFMKHKIITGILLLLIIGAIGSAGEDNSNPSTSEKDNSTSQEVVQNTDTEETEEVSVEETEEEPVEEVAKEDVPTEYKSALKKAKIYSDTMAMSKSGLYDQLTSEYGEKFTAEAAQYAIDNVVADWNKNALAKAKTYQDTMAMSPSAIYDQLISEYGEKFTEEEAQYAIDNLE